MLRVFAKGCGANCTPGLRPGWRKFHWCFNFIGPDPQDQISCSAHQGLGTSAKVLSQSTVDELRCPFVQKGVHAFFLVGSGKQAVEQAALKHHAVGQAAFEGAVHAFFGRDH